MAPPSASRKKSRFPLSDSGEYAADTWAVCGGRPELPGEPLNVGLAPASNYRLGGERVYARSDPSAGWTAFETLIGGWEGGEAVAFASGMAACAALFDGLGYAAHVVLGDDCYLGTSALLDSKAERHGWKIERLALDDDRWAARAAQADLLWVESPSNPLLEVADVAAICAAPRRDGTKVVVDNTFCTPLLQRPLELGADFAVHSATKAIGGHSDLLLGVAVAKDSDDARRLRAARALTGATPGTLECFLALRGARTLPLRLQRASDNAADLARRLAEHPAIADVRYPGFSTIISFDLADAATADRALAQLRLIVHATSLGGVESTAERRATHPGQEKIPPGLIRLSVGCEDVEDLWHDLQRALD